MPINDATINSLPFGKDVYDDLTYCMQEWQNAGFEAVQALSDPEEEKSTFDWVITLIGNLAWAATVFFPPALVTSTAIVKATSVLYNPRLINAELILTSSVASVSRATKAVTVLGGTLASDVVGKLRKLAGDLRSPIGKAFLADYLGNQVPDLLKQYAAGADSWVKKDLINHMISQYSVRFHPHANDNNDAGFVGFYNSVAGGEERRKYVWEDFVFPDFRTPYDNKTDDKGGKWLGGRSGLKKAISGPLESALKDFDRQWKKYQSDLNSHVRAAEAGGRGVGEFAKADYMKRHPFNPVLKYSGVPDKLQAQQQSNQRKLGNLVRAND